MTLVWHYIPQRTAEWFALRSGKLTGSVAKKMLASIKSGEAADRRDLRYRLIAERLTGRPQENGYVNDDMIWGIEHEADAVAAYEAATGELVTPCGFVESATLPVGTSPDGLVSEDGLLSVKCPKTATHCRYLREGVEPSEHAAQNTHELWLTGRAWLDFVSFDPRLPAKLQLCRVRVTRTPKELDAYGEKVRAFLADVETALLAMQTTNDLKGQLHEAVGVTAGGQ